MVSSLDLSILITSLLIGFQHKVKLKHCHCEEITLTMARSQIWPATPVNPRVGFTFGMLDLAEAMLLKCQVALKDFCAALKFRCPYYQNLVSINIVIEFSLKVFFRNRITTHN